MLFNILHHENPAEITKEAWRILRPGGTVGAIHWIHSAATPPRAGQRWRSDQNPRHFSSFCGKAGFKQRRPCQSSCRPGILEFSLLKRSCVEKNGRNFVWGRLKNDLGIVGRVGCKENLLNNNYFSLIDSWPSGEIASIHLELGSLPTIKAKYIIKAGTFIGVGLFLKNDDHQIYVDNPEGVERISVPQKIST